MASGLPFFMIYTLLSSPTVREKLLQQLGDGRVFLVTSQYDDGRTRRSEIFWIIR